MATWNPAGAAMALTKETLMSLTESYKPLKCLVMLISSGCSSIGQGVYTDNLAPKNTNLASIVHYDNWVRSGHIVYIENWVNGFAQHEGKRRGKNTWCEFSPAKGSMKT